MYGAIRTGLCSYSCVMTLWSPGEGRLVLLHSGCPTGGAVRYSSTCSHIEETKWQRQDLVCSCVELINDKYDIMRKRLGITERKYQGEMVGVECRSVMALSSPRTDSAVGQGGTKNHFQNTFAEG